MREEYENIAVTACMIILFIGMSFSLVIFTMHKTSPNCDLNHDNELTIKDLSILAAEINNK